jgi:mono/diheme cytochrome c family protein
VFRWQYRLALGILLLIAGAGLLIAQDGNPITNPECAPEVLASQQAAFMQILKFDFENAPDTSIANMFRLGAVYQDLAIKCGYQPSQQEIDALIQRTLSLTDLQTLIAANAVGEDVAAILTELATVRGDVLHGQELYNGLAPVLDGSLLGCAACHNGQTAPSVEGTWTRVNDIRLLEPQLAGYTVEQYLIESIVHPNAYIAPDYLEGLMPTFYGTRLDLQQLADLLAYLMSQDQLLEE